ncbi:hypothetical protein B0H10DRAFT_1947128 [Mycena sp. CBHHK59/15]|nr:hypothetical protein B0H10DRAFT_1947128 [Mycena sp. CBHHK59/15]
MYGHDRSQARSQPRYGPYYHGGYEDSVQDVHGPGGFYTEDCIISSRDLLRVKHLQSSWTVNLNDGGHSPKPPTSSIQIDALFAMLTVQQTQMTELIGQNKQMRDEHQTMQPSGAPSIHGARGLASNRGAFTRSKQRAVRQLHLGLQSPQSVDSEDELPPPPSVAASTNPSKMHTELLNSIRMRADKLSISCWSAESASRE